MKRINVQTALRIGNQLRRNLIQRHQTTSNVKDHLTSIVTLIAKTPSISRCSQKLSNSILRMQDKEDTQSQRIKRFKDAMRRKLQISRRYSQLQASYRCSSVQLSRAKMKNAQSQAKQRLVEQRKQEAEMLRSIKDKFNRQKMLRIKHHQLQTKLKRLAQRTGFSLIEN